MGLLGRHAWWLVLVGALIAIAHTFRLWWTPVFAGLPNTLQGVDVGNHLLLYQRFTIYDWREYQGLREARSAGGRYSGTA